MKYLCPQLTNTFVDDYVYTFLRMDLLPNSPLTTREREILQLIAEGKSTKGIAEVLKIGMKTVETHRRQIMHKLKVFNVAQLTQYALREGLISV
jgi:DNA-binding NarL/FixJ family response regulator